MPAAQGLIFPLGFASTLSYLRFTTALRASVAGEESEAEVRGWAYSVPVKLWFHFAMQGSDVIPFPLAEKDSLLYVDVEEREDPDAAVLASVLGCKDVAHLLRVAHQALIAGFMERAVVDGKHSLRLADFFPLNGHLAPGHRSQQQLAAAASTAARQGKKFDREAAEQLKLMQAHGTLDGPLAEIPADRQQVAVSFVMLLYRAGGQKMPSPKSIRPELLLNADTFLRSASEEARDELLSHVKEAATEGKPPSILLTLQSATRRLSA